MVERPAPKRARASNGWAETAARADSTSPERAAPGSCVGVSASQKRGTRRRRKDRECARRESNRGLRLERPLMPTRSPSAAVVVREHDDQPFYEAKFIYRWVEQDPGTGKQVKRHKQVKRRLGPAWLDRTEQRAPWLEPYGGDLPSQPLRLRPHPPPGRRQRHSRLETRRPARGVDPLILERGQPFHTDAGPKPSKKVGRRRLYVRSRIEALLLDDEGELSP